MKRLILPAAAIIFAAAFALAPDPGSENVRKFTVDKAHSEVSFTVRHMTISRVKGTFDDFDADISFDPEDFSSLKVVARAGAQSINTRHERRDNHLRSDDFFDSATHPDLTFVSREVREIEGESFKLAGDLTIRGVTKPVVFDVTYNGSVIDAQGRQRVALSAATTVNRHDYGVSWNRTLDAGGVVVGDNVQINLEIQAISAE